MASDALEIVVGHRSDRVARLLDAGPLMTRHGEVRVVQAGDPVDCFRRLQEGDCAGAEMSLAFHTILTSRGGSPFVGLPVFVSRAFRHENILVRAGGGISSPADLAGCAIAVAEYAATMVVWLRAMLDQEYGVPSDAVEWVVCRPPVVLGGPPAPAGIRVRTEYGAEPVDLLATGAVDAAFDFEGSRAPGLLEKGITGIFSNPWAEVERYYRATRIFPIMHLMVLRKDVHDAAPKLARELYEAFETAKEDAAQALQGTDGLPLMLPRLAQFLASEHALFGADLWPYGVQANSATLEAFVAHCHRQGLLSGDVSVPDLFVEELA